MYYQIKCIQYTPQYACLIAHQTIYIRIHLNKLVFQQFSTYVPGVLFLKTNIIIDITLHKQIN